MLVDAEVLREPIEWATGVLPAQATTGLGDVDMAIAGAFVDAVALYEEPVDDTIVIGPLRIQWLGPSHCAPSLAVKGRVSSRRVCAADPQEIEAARELVLRSRVSRRRSFRKCADCGEPTPPEFRISVDRRQVCHACASENHGVVF